MGVSDDADRMNAIGPRVRAWDAARL